MRLARFEFRHEGRCGRCGRALTVPESIDTGFGPHCAAEMGVPWTKTDEAPDPRLAAWALTFALGGNARFTVTSKRTGERFTYRVRRSQRTVQQHEVDRARVERGHISTTAPWFVSVLTGEDNEGDYSYLGTIWEEPKP